MYRDTLRHTRCRTPLRQHIQEGFPDLGGFADPNLFKCTLSTAQLTMDEVRIQSPIEPPLLPPAAPCLTSHQVIMKPSVHPSPISARPFPRRRGWLFYDFRRCHPLRSCWTTKMGGLDSPQLGLGTISQPQLALYRPPPLSIILPRRLRVSRALQAVFDSTVLQCSL